MGDRGKWGRCGAPHDVESDLGFSDKDVAFDDPELVQLARIRVRFEWVVWIWVKGTMVHYLPANLRGDEDAELVDKVGEYCEGAVAGGQSATG